MSRDHHGPSAREQQILDLWEADVGPDSIAAQLGLSPSYVQQIIRSLAAPKGEDWQSAARFGSESLIRAIRRYHPDRCGAPS